MTTPAAPMLIVREDWFEHPDERAAFEEEFGRELNVPKPFAELREVAGYFTREEGESVAGETLERDLHGWADALGSGAGITRNLIVMLYSTGVNGWDENFEPDIDQLIVAEVAAGDVSNSPLPLRQDNLAGYIQGTSFLGGGGVFLPALVGVLESVFIRQGIPEYGGVMWNGTTDLITDVCSGDLEPGQAQERWVQMMTEAFEAAGYRE